MAGTYQAGRSVPGKISGSRIAICVARWNEDVTGALYEAAVQTLQQLGIRKQNIIRKDVPGSFELPLAALRVARKKDIHAVICLGCVIQGETPHFDYICQAVSYGIMNVGLKTGKPVIFGVLTTLNKQQALDRAGGKRGNKGEDAAITAVQMLGL